MLETIYNSSFIIMQKFSNLVFLAKKKNIHTNQIILYSEILFKYDLILIFL